MYYPLYNNPFYYPNGAYIPNMCSYGVYTQDFNTKKQAENPHEENNQNYSRTNSEIKSNDFFSINGDRLEVFGISINIDDLIILIMLFFMFRESQIDYSIIIILALILFDQS